MNAPPKLSLVTRLRVRIENVIVTSLVPLDGPGLFFRWLFKAPLLFDSLGLHRMLPAHVLILVTVGRKSGKLRRTPVEYSYDTVTDTYQVMAGWAGKTDWYRNACANPKVMIRLHGETMNALAERMPDVQVGQLLCEITRMNPGSLKIWSRWANRELDGSEESLRQAAPYFPTLILRPCPPATRTNSA